MSVPRRSAHPTRLLHLSDLHVGATEAPAVERSLAALIERIEPELVVASGDLTHRGQPHQHAAAAAYLRSLGTARAGDPRQPRHPLHVSGPVQEDVRRVRAALGDHRARLRIRSFARRRTEFGARVAAPVGRDPRAAAGPRPRGAGPGARGRAEGGDAAPPSDRSALAFEEEARVAAVESARRPRRRRSGADPCRPHPSGRGQRAARVRGDPRRDPRRGGLRSPPASASRGRTGAARRAASTSTRRTRTRSASRPTSGARTTGGSRPSARSRAAASPSP